MILSKLTAIEQGQLALAVADILTRGISTSEEIDALLVILAALRDNVAIYAYNIKKAEKGNTTVKS